MNIKNEIKDMTRKVIRKIKPFSRDHTGTQVVEISLFR